MITPEVSPLTYLPTALTEYPQYVAGSSGAHQVLLDAGFPAGSEPIWEFSYRAFWDLIQRTLREELDPTFDGENQAGHPFCAPGTPTCAADYELDIRASRPDRRSDRNIRTRHRDRADDTATASPRARPCSSWTHLRAHGERHAALLALRAADHWFESSGGGDGAALAACLHSAMDAEDEDPTAQARLHAVLQRSCGQHTPDIEIMAMDALARRAVNDHHLAEARDLFGAADDLMPSARHLLGSADRLDADHARTLITAGSTSK